MSNTNSDICAVAEVETALGLTAPTDAQRGLITLAKKMAESDIRTFLGYNVTQKAYIGTLQPDMNLFYSQADYIDVTNNRLVLWGWSDSSVLQMPEIPVRSVQSVKADYSALADQGSGDFPANSQLIQGIDYYLDWDTETAAGPGATEGISWSGHIIRWISAWPARRRSVKVEYTAGISADELDGKSSTWNHSLDPSQIKWAAILASMAKYHTMKGFQHNAAGGIGPISSESLADYSVTYLSSVLANTIGMQQMLPPQVQHMLGPFRRIRR